MAKYILLGIAAIAAAIYRIFTLETDAAATELSIKDIQIKNHLVILTGDVLQSSKAFYRYTYYVKDNNLFLTIKTGFVRKKSKNGHFHIEFEEPTDFEHIYLKTRRNSILIF